MGDNIIFLPITSFISQGLLENDDIVTRIFFGYILFPLLWWLYFALMESSSKQATLGKMLLGIIVTDLNNNRISFGKASGRYWGKLISIIILGIGFIMAGTTSKKQALHDKMAGTLVIIKSPEKQL